MLAFGNNFAISKKGVAYNYTELHHSTIQLYYWNKITTAQFKHCLHRIDEK